MSDLEEENLFITHFICESHNAAMTLKWKSISANAF